MNAIYTAVGTNEYADTTGTGAISERNESESAHHHQSNFGELKLNGQFEYRLKMGDLIKFASFQLSEVNQVAFKATEKHRHRIKCEQIFCLHICMERELIRSNEDVYITIGKIGPFQCDSRQ